MDFTTPQTQRNATEKEYYLLNAPVKPKVPEVPKGKTKDYHFFKYDYTAIYNNIDTSSVELDLKLIKSKLEFN